MRIYRIKGKKGHTYGIDYRDADGARVRRMIGTEAEAKLALEQVRARLFAQEHLGAEPALVRGSRMTIGEAERQWWASRPNIREASRRAMQAVWARILAFWPRQTQMADITWPQIERFKDELLKELKPGTVNTTMIMLSGALSRAAKAGAIRQNPMRGKWKQIPVRGRQRTCSREEFELLMSEAPERLRVAMSLAYYMGLSRQEIVDLEWGHVDLREGWLHAYRTKTQVGRLLPMPEQVRRALELLPGPRSGNVLDWKDHSLTVAFMRHRNGVGIKGLTFHDFRHSAATRLRRQGTDLLVLREIFGWRDLRMTQRYSHVSFRELQLALKRKDEGDE